MKVSKRKVNDVDYELPTVNELAAMANESWGSEDEDIYDVVRIDCEKPLINPRITVVKNRSAGDRIAFKILKAYIKAKPSCLIGLAVGKTTDSLYKLISKDAKKNANAWKKIKLFQIDEKIGISPNSSLSFNFEIRRELKDLLKITKKENVFLINGLKNPKETIKKAYLFIKKNKGIDLIILGLGPNYDPHIAYNTTGKSSINSRMRVVELHHKNPYRRDGESGNRRKICKGITLGIKDILECKKALLITYGKDKARSFSLAFNRNVNMKRASASALQLHKNLTVVIDKTVVK